MYVHGLLTTEQQTLEPFCEGATDYMEPLFTIVSSNIFEIL